MKIKESTGMGEGKSFRLSTIILGSFLLLLLGTDEIYRSS